MFGYGKISLHINSLAAIILAAIILAAMMLA
jgi:hypothetical protein